VRLGNGRHQALAMHSGCKMRLLKRALEHERRLGPRWVGAGETREPSTSSAAAAIRR
jgi:hypothetical protein